jgi:hypothetical protein
MNKIKISGYCKVCDLAKIPTDSAHIWYGLKTNKDRAECIFDRMKRFKNARGYSVDYIVSVLEDYIRKENPRTELTEQEKNHNKIALRKINAAFAEVFSKIRI